MTERHTSPQHTETPDHTRKAPEAWVTSDEPRTGVLHGPRSPRGVPQRRRPWMRP